MREVEASRFVRAPAPEVRRALTPERLVAAEGSFSVQGVRDGDGETVVEVAGGGLGFTLRFEERADGYYYTQAGEGPFAHMETWVTVASENEGARVTMRSAVELALPVALPGSDRLAGWKRRGELKRALRALAREFG